MKQNLPEQRRNFVIYDELTSLERISENLLLLIVLTSILEIVFKFPRK